MSVTVQFSWRDRSMKATGVRGEDLCQAVQEVLGEISWNIILKDGRAFVPFALATEDKQYTVFTGDHALFKEARAFAAMYQLEVRVSGHPLGHCVGPVQFAKGPPVYITARHVFEKSPATTKIRQSDGQEFCVGWAKTCSLTTTNGENLDVTLFQLKDDSRGITPYNYSISSESVTIPLGLPVEACSSFIRPRMALHGAASSTDPHQPRVDVVVPPGFSGACGFTTLYGPTLLLQLEEEDVSSVKSVEKTPEGGVTEPGTISTAFADLGKLVEKAILDTKTVGRGISLAMVGDIWASKEDCEWQKTF
eukprot:TRINITY_DN25976_c0_g1_i1.p1 TRINITY_DN25976_c0_g1~~TRINITY_DN25976_c0_g1_i1.p1  ORF type:complete len:307 (+),score=8.11 TRINITY_DN25976_c0_g1_i1:38-958(+)